MARFETIFFRSEISSTVINLLPVSMTSHLRLYVQCHTFVCRDDVTETAPTGFRGVFAVNA